MKWIELNRIEKKWQVCLYCRHHLMSVCGAVACFAFCVCRVDVIFFLLNLILLFVIQFCQYLLLLSFLYVWHVCLTLLSALAASGGQTTISSLEGGSKVLIGGSGGHRSGLPSSLFLNHPSLLPMAAGTALGLGNSIVSKCGRPLFPDGMSPSPCSSPDSSCSSSDLLHSPHDLGSGQDWVTLPVNQSQDQEEDLKPPITTKASLSLFLPSSFVCSLFLSCSLSLSWCQKYTKWKRGEIKRQRWRRDVVKWRDLHTNQKFTWRSSGSWPTEYSHFSAIVVFFFFTLCLTLFLWRVKRNKRMDNRHWFKNCRNQRKELIINDHRAKTKTKNFYLLQDSSQTSALTRQENFKPKKWWEVNFKRLTVTKRQPYQKPIYQKITKTKNTEGKALSRGPVNSPASSTRPTPTIQRPPTPSFHPTFFHLVCLNVCIFVFKSPLFLLVKRWISKY